MMMIIKIISRTIQARDSLNFISASSSVNIMLFGLFSKKLEKHCQKRIHQKALYELFYKRSSLNRASAAQSNTGTDSNKQTKNISPLQHIT